MVVPKYFCYGCCLYRAIPFRQGGRPDFRLLAAQHTRRNYGKALLPAGPALCRPATFHSEAPGTGTLLPALPLLRDSGGTGRRNFPLCFLILSGRCGTLHNSLGIGQQIRQGLNTAASFAPLGSWFLGSVFRYSYAFTFLYGFACICNNAV